jgi:hypothetical protein
MREIVQDIVDDPGEYMLVLSILAGLLVVWSSLCLSGFISLRTSAQPRKFWFALVPFVLGLLGVWARIPFSVEGQSGRLSLDLRWFFSLPLLLGAAALVFWWRARRRQANAG